MTVTIPAGLDDFVRTKIEAGEFENPSDVVAAALAAWQGQEVECELDHAEVERALLEAVDTPRIPWDEANLDRIMESLRAKYGTA